MRRKIPMIIFLGLESSSEKEHPLFEIVLSLGNGTLLGVWSTGGDAR
jgi:hypothetical protein